MMTREEAIKEIIRAYDVLDFSCHMDNRRKEAFNMAKVALEQEPILDKIRAELLSTKGKWWYGVENDCFMKLSDVLQIIDKYRKEQE